MGGRRGRPGPPGALARRRARAHQHLGDARRRRGGAGRRRPARLARARDLRGLRALVARLPAAAAHAPTRCRASRATARAVRRRGRGRRRCTTASPSDARGAIAPQARAALGLPPDAFVVAVLGRVSGWKGQDVLVRALGEAPLRGRPTPSHWWRARRARGEERHRRELHALAARARRRRPPATTSASSDDLASSTAPPTSSPCPPSSPTRCPTPRSRRPRRAAASSPPPTAGCRRSCATARPAGSWPPRDPAALAGVLAELAGDPAQRERLGAAAARDVARALRAPARCSTRSRRSTTACCPISRRRPARRRRRRPTARRSPGSRARAAPCGRRPRRPPRRGCPRPGRRCARRSRSR